ncbi:MAG: beta-lactamase-like protein 2 [Candidatus Lambdaproteobacteria bacterium]|nr:beta-lactamase-like protein 2 [Candidatus Lambdaproteobacteria bacterium]
MPDLLPGAEGFPRTAVLSPSVHRVLGLNPSAFTGPGTNTYLVGMHGPGPLLIDTGSGLDAYTALLRGYLRETQAPPLTRILLTHVHPDHIGGAGDVRGIFPNLPVHKFPWPGKDERYNVPLQAVRDGERFQGPGYTLRAVHTPGHARDHICYYYEEERALFTGDVILGVGTTVIPRDGGDLGDYLATLERLLALDLKRIYPGHGPVIEDGPAKVREYLAHRLERERQILHELRHGPRTIMEMVAEIYREYPKHLHNAAGESVLSHLDKLVKEGRVLNQGGAPARYTLAA